MRKKVLLMASPVSSMASPEVGSAASGLAMDSNLEKMKSMASPEAAHVAASEIDKKEPESPGTGSGSTTAKTAKSSIEAAVQAQLAEVSENFRKQLNEDDWGWNVARADAAGAARASSSCNDELELVGP